MPPVMFCQSEVIRLATLLKPWPKRSNHGIAPIIPNGTKEPVARTIGFCRLPCYAKCQSPAHATPDPSGTVPAKQPAHAARRETVLVFPASGTSVEYRQIYLPVSGHAIP